MMWQLHVRLFFFHTVVTLLAAAIPVSDQLSPDDFFTYLEQGHFDELPFSNITVPLISRDDGEPCGDITEAVASLPGGLQSTSVSLDAEAVYSCLKSIKAVPQDIDQLIEAIKRMIEYHVHLDDLKDQELAKRMGFEREDIIANLDEIRDKVMDGSQTQQYVIESFISRFMLMARDQRFNWVGSLFSLFRWTRPAALELIWAVAPGQVEPAVYLAADVRQKVYRRVATIGRQKAAEYFFRNSMTPLYDRNARWNAFFTDNTVFQSGSFLYPLYYPGTYTSLVLEDGTPLKGRNRAILRQKWSPIQTAEAAYTAFVRWPSNYQLPTLDRRDNGENNYFSGLHSVAPSATSLGNGAWSLTRRDRRLEDLRQLAGQEDRVWSAFFPASPNLKVAVLRLGNFDASASDTSKFIKTLLSQSTEKGVGKLIIDVRNNVHGDIAAAVVAFLTIFPAADATLPLRFRVPNTLKYFGFMYDQHKPDFLSPWDPRSLIDFRTGSYFTKFQQLISDPGPLGRGETADFSQPFAVQGLQFLHSGVTGDNTLEGNKILILTDGLCLAACAIFAELLLTRTTGIKSIFAGGAPLDPGTPNENPGTGSVAGGNRAVQALTLEQIVAFADFARDKISATAAAKLPFLPPVRHSASIVQLFQVMKEDFRTSWEWAPTKAQCRVWGEPGDADGSAAWWGEVADIAFGAGDGGMKLDRCAFRL